MKYPLHQHYYNLTRNLKYIIFLDGILVTRDFTEAHLKKLTEVLIRLRQHGLRVRPSKCAFMQESVEYWGHKRKYTLLSAK